MPTVHRLFDPETAHRLALKMAAYKLTPRYGANHKEYVSLRCEFLDMPLKNPIGLFVFDESFCLILQIQVLRPASTRAARRSPASSRAASALWKLAP